MATTEEHLHALTQYAGKVEEGLREHLPEAVAARHVRGLMRAVEISASVLRDYEYRGHPRLGLLNGLEAPSFDFEYYIHSPGSLSIRVAVPAPAASTA